MYDGTLVHIDFSVKSTPVGTGNCSKSSLSEEQPFIQGKVKAKAAPAPMLRKNCFLSIAFGVYNVNVRFGVFVWSIVESSVFTLDGQHFTVGPRNATHYSGIDAKAF